jgi:hypothetical protein
MHSSENLIQHRHHLHLNHAYISAEQERCRAAILFVSHEHTTMPSRFLHSPSPTSPSFARPMKALPSIAIYMDNPATHNVALTTTTPRIHALATTRSTTSLSTVRARPFNVPALLLHLHLPILVYASMSALLSAVQEARAQGMDEYERNDEVPVLVGGA